MMQIHPRLRAHLLPDAISMFRSDRQSIVAMSASDIITRSVVRPSAGYYQQLL
jgi:hypothetical protein